MRTRPARISERHHAPRRTGAERPGEAGAGAGRGALEEVGGGPEDEAEDQQGHDAASSDGDRRGARQQPARGDDVQVLDDAAVDDGDALAARLGRLEGGDLASRRARRRRATARRPRWRSRAGRGGSASCRRSPCRGPGRRRRAGPRRPGRRCRRRRRRPAPRRGRRAGRGRGWRRAAAGRACARRRDPWRGRWCRARSPRAAGGRRRSRRRSARRAASPSSPRAGCAPARRAGRGSSAAPMTCSGRLDLRQQDRVGPGERRRGPGRPRPTRCRGR